MLMALFAPLLPLFVVITIAPSFALEPYSAVAAAPLRIVIDSISSELKSPIRFPKSTLLAVVPPAEFDSLTDNPSIT
ncbi:hypothetical protein D3C71_1799800 [compost metagenome]